MGAEVSGIKAGHLGIYMRTGDAAAASGGAHTGGADTGGGVTQGFERMARAGGIDPAAWSNRELFVPSFEVKQVASATGAGDSSIAGVLAAIIRGEGPEQALRIGSASGASACMTYDPTGKLEDYDKLSAAIDAGWRVNEAPGFAEAGFHFNEGAGVWIGPSDREHKA
jgi:hypothetical protein